eukprot:4345706-Pleurochrysis_carterae.AAC.2
MELRFDMIWARTVEIPPFKVDNIIAVDFLCTILDRFIGTRIQHSFAITETVAVQVGQLFLKVRDADCTKCACSRRMPAGQPVTSCLLI